MSSVVSGSCWYRDSVWFHTCKLFLLLLPTVEEEHENAKLEFTSCTSVSNLLPAPFWTVSIYEQCRCTEAVHAKVQSFMVDFHGGKVAISRLLYLLWYTCLSRRTEIVLFSSFKVKCFSVSIIMMYVFVAANTCFINSRFYCYLCWWCTPHVHSSREILRPETKVQLGMALCWLYNLLPCRWSHSERRLLMRFLPQPVS